MADPDRWEESLGSFDGHIPREVPKPSPTDPFDRLRILRADRKSFRTIPNLPPFQSGFAGVFGYDLNSHLERIPSRAENNDLPVPVMCVGEYSWVISFDHIENRAWFVRKPHSNKGVPDLPKLLAASAQPPRHRPTTPANTLPRHPLPGIPSVFSNFSREDYIAAVQRVIDYIHAGDVFQVNLSQRLLTPLVEHPLELYGRLRTVSPSPYGCYFDLGDCQILSASPEQFLRVASTGEVITRPIKGTRPRGRTPEEDEALLRDLTTNPKDRAENVMIVDLLRNDIGKVCEYGSVIVPKVCEIESYPYVHHLVSEVRGRLPSGHTSFDLLKAAFPGGSVSGAPKVRAMEIIAELEPTARGAYCGSIGFLGHDGAMDTNILIRTFTASAGWLQFPVGGGIVADSIPQREYEETLHKAAGLLRALKRQ
jgi:para-aminobenzoate synthetase component I